MIKTFKFYLKVNILLYVLFFLFFQGAHADDDKFGLIFVPKSDHFSDRGEPNENNNLVGFKYNKWGVATYENSQFDRTFTLSYDFYEYDIELSEKWSFSAKVPFAIAHGYNRDKAVNLFGFVGFVFLESSIEYEIANGISIRGLALVLPTLGGGAVAGGFGITVEI